jgi:hypothetical protein
MPISKNEAARNAWIKLLLGAGFIGIGCFVVYLAIEMVGIFGESMGVDAASRWIYAKAHIAVHVFGTASSIAIGLFVLGRNRGLAALAMAAILFSGGYGIINMIGFTTTNRLSVSESRSAATAADWKHYEAQRANLQAELDWLRKTEVNADTPRERKLLLSRIDAKLNELNAIQPPRPSADKVLADPQATWFSKLTGWTTENWQLALPVPVAFLLFAAEVLSFVFAVHLIATAIETLHSISSSNANSSGGTDGGGDRKLETEVKQFPKPKAVPSVAAKIAIAADQLTDRAMIDKSDRSVDRLGLAINPSIAAADQIADQTAAIAAATAVSDRSVDRPYPAQRSEKSSDHSADRRADHRRSRHAYDHAAVRARVAAILAETPGLPQRTIAMIAGCSQSSVSETKRWLRKQRARRARRQAAPAAKTADDAVQTIH